jgi:hypothetical protein
MSAGEEKKKVAKESMFRKGGMTLERLDEQKKEKRLKERRQWSG